MKSNIIPLTANGIICTHFLIDFCTVLQIKETFWSRAAVHGLALCDDSSSSRNAVHSRISRVSRRTCITFTCHEKVRTINIYTHTACFCNWWAAFWLWFWRDIDNHFYGWLCSTVGKTPVFGRRTDPVLSSACSRRGDHYVAKPSATGQPTRPTQPFILMGSINE